MKINKKILGLSIAGVAAIATIPTLAITLTSCSKSVPVGKFYEAFNDPYKELEMYARNLDANKIGLFQPSNQSSKDSEEKLEFMPGFTSFLDAAEKINNSMRQYVINLANTDAIRNFRDQNKTVLFVRSPKLSGSLEGDALKNALNTFSMEQPILYQQIYSTPEIEKCPGFGFKFPMPINSKSNGLFDDWYQIGAKQLSNISGNNNISWRLSESWKGTADFVFYLYDSSKIDTKDEQNIINTIYNITPENSNNYIVGKLLKKDAVVQHIIPIDIQYMYNGIWDQVGSFAMDYLFAKIFNNVENNGIKKFEVIGQKDKKTNDSVDSIVENASWNPYRMGNSGSNVKENKQPTSFGIARPIESSKNQNFAVASYNIIAHTFALGINPDYISEFKGNESDDYKYKYFMGYLTPFKDKISNSSNVNEKFFWENSNNFLNFLQNKKIYALGDNREKFGGDAVKIPDFSYELTKPNEGTISLAASSDGGKASPTTPAVLKTGVKPIFSEQNESPATQYQFPSDLQLMINTNTGVLLTVPQWKKEQ